ncbi:Hypothetical predicted protein [Mytilus galloprovincialis]|uniref:DUF6570 domain-containing protein n=1 Tax=Mytilus galloprovincialis TaxID=29158 RepID=A0A8B6F9P3_MYTGA|nr:Hypothetical predicted protein [Mytilus galloprovincialis]
MSKDNECKHCHLDKSPIKFFSAEKNMDPKHIPSELADLTIVEQQLICRISPCINIQMLGHWGIASGGHCVTFPQEVNEPAKIFPRLPEEINVIRVRKQGKNGTSKDFEVRRLKIQTALLFLKEYNSAYFDIIISKEWLAALPLDGELSDIQTVKYQANNVHISDNGPPPDQTDPGEVEGCCAEYRMLGMMKYPNFAWHPSVLVSEDRLCYVVNTPTVKARNNEIE